MYVSVTAFYLCSYFIFMLLGSGCGAAVRWRGTDCRSYYSSSYTRGDLCRSDLHDILGIVGVGTISPSGPPSQGPGRQP